MTMEHDALAALTTLTSEAEGQLMVNILKENDIDAALFTSQLLSGAIGTVQVMVKQDSLSNARSVLVERDKLLASRQVRH